MLVMKFCSLRYRGGAELFWNMHVKKVGNLWLPKSYDNFPCQLSQINFW
jgi:hypothetical protein